MRSLVYLVGAGILGFLGLGYVAGQATNVVQSIDPNTDREAVYSHFMTHPLDAWNTWQSGWPPAEAFIYSFDGGFGVGDLSVQV